MRLFFARVGSKATRPIPKSMWSPTWIKIALLTSSQAESCQNSARQVWVSDRPAFSILSLPLWGRRKLTAGSDMQSPMGRHARIWHLQNGDLTPRTFPKKLLNFWQQYRVVSNCDEQYETSSASDNIRCGFYFKYSVINRKEIRMNNSHFTWNNMQQSQLTCRKMSFSFKWSCNSWPE